MNNVKKRNVSHFQGVRRRGYSWPGLLLKQSELVRGWKFQTAREAEGLSVFVEQMHQCWGV